MAFIPIFFPAKFTKKDNKDLAQIVVQTVKLFIILEIFLITGLTLMYYSENKGASIVDFIGLTLYLLILFSLGVAILSFFLVGLYHLTSSSFKLTKEKK